MSKIYDVKNVQVTQEELCFEIAGNDIHVPLSQTGSSVLPQTRPEYLQIYNIDDDGIGIHWPVVDEDLSIEGPLRSAGREDLIVREIPSIYLEEDSSPTESQKLAYSHR